MLGTKKNVTARESLNAASQVVRHVSAPVSIRAEIPEYARRELRPGYLRVLCPRGDSLDLPRSMTVAEIMKRTADHMLNCPFELVTIHYATAEVPTRPTGEPFVQASEPYGDTPFTVNNGIGRQYLKEQDPDYPHIPELGWTALKLPTDRRVSDLIQPCGLDEQERNQKIDQVAENVAPLDCKISFLIPPEVKYLMVSKAGQMKAMTVYVRTYAHRTITLHNIIMISDIKRGIYKAIGVGPERQKLFFKGRVLQHDYPLQEEGVCHGDVIFLADPLKDLRYHLYEHAQSRRPVGTKYPKYPQRIGAGMHCLSVGVNNWVGMEQLKGSWSRMATVHDRDWTMNLTRDDLWPSNGARGDTRGPFQRDKIWLNASNVF
jgi:hypothetical protein